MRPLAFTIGPSRLSPATEQDIRDALGSGILEWSHRGKDFCDMSTATIMELRSFFGVPEEYSIFYVSSATEAIERTIVNLVEHESCHFTAGRFAELFAEISALNGRKALQITGPWGSVPAFDGTKIPPSAELITITANETSTGVLCLSDDIQRIRATKPDAMLAVDITSIAGMKVFPISAADVWLLSVQKACGLPAGLGIMIVSRRALERAAMIAKKKPNAAGYFTFQEMEKLMQKKGQTICTPNVLDIFLLGRQMKRWNEHGGCVAQEAEGKKKATQLYGAIEQHPSLQCFVKDPALRSISIACIEGTPETIEHLHAAAKAKNMLLGKGYGKLKETTIRIGLFPAISENDLTKLIDVIATVA